MLFKALFAVDTGFNFGQLDDVSDGVAERMQVKAHLVDSIVDVGGFVAVVVQVEFELDVSEVGGDDVRSKAVLNDCPFVVDGVVVVSFADIL